MAQEATATPLGNGRGRQDVQTGNQTNDARILGEFMDIGFFGSVCAVLRKLLFSVLSVGPLPKHIAFIMDGNRRFAKSQNLELGQGHRVGYSALKSTLLYCYELGIKYVSIYAFSIDNFKRNPDEVDDLMTLLLEKIDELLGEDGLVKKYQLRVNFWGNLSLLKESVHLAAKRAMAATAGNVGPVLSICVAYTSTDEITHAIGESVKQKVYKENLNGSYRDNGEKEISVEEIEKNLYTANCPDPDIVIRTSGENRLSNFLLWQTAYSHLQNPAVLWPEFSLKDLVWAILQYQRVHPYLEKLKKIS